MADLDRAGLEHWRGKIESLLNRLTIEAEAWAAAGTAKVDQVSPRREPARRAARFARPAHLLAGPATSVRAA